MRTDDGVRTVGVTFAGGRGYDVRVGPGIAASGFSDLKAVLGYTPERAFVVLDAGVPDASRHRVIEGLRGSGVRAFDHVFVPTERDKSIATLEQILHGMLAARLERRDPVIAIGGGIVGDLAGFAAASYRRGVPVIQCPTTLLSMVDASVGGKTGINLTLRHADGGERLVKNMAGAFWQPRMVLADTSFLESLPDRDFRAGLGECIKHGLLSAGIDDGLGAWLDASLPAVLARDAATLTELVARNVGVKAAVVAADEREQAATGGRALLNLGHTFAHAIEPIASLTPTGNATDAPLRHGEAVALGLVAAAGAGVEMGLIDAEDAERVRARVRAAGLPDRIGGLPSKADLIDAMWDDKKVAGGDLRLVVPDGPASSRVVTRPAPASLEAGWTSIWAEGP
jgi:3-dehydroquinate synthetase